MASYILMPGISAQTTQAILHEWKITVGAHITQGMLLAEIETDKAMVELYAEQNGTIAKLLANNGEMVDVGAAIALLHHDGETDDEPASALSQENLNEKPPPEQVPSPQYLATLANTLRQMITNEAPDKLEKLENTRRFISPIARSLSQQHGLNLSELTGSGPNARITRSDIEHHLNTNKQYSAVETQQPSALSQTSDELIIPLTPMRKIIAKRLLESKTNAPHYYVEMLINMDNLHRLRQEINKVFETRININDFIIKAAAQTLNSHPEVNVRWGADKIYQRTTTDIALAVATTSGLITPIITDAAEKSLTNIAKARQQLVIKARQGQLLPSEYQGGGLTISNLGSFGVSAFTAIINPPQSAILAIGTISKVPTVTDDDNITIIRQMRATLSADHRVIDGVLAAQWLQQFKQLLEHPLALLL